MASEIYPFVEIVDYPARFAPEGAAADALREVARQRVRERLLLIERVMAGPFLLPGGFSLLDIYAAMFSRWSVGGEWRRANLPRLTALAAAVSTAAGHRAGLGAALSRSLKRPVPARRRVRPGRL